MTSFELDLRRNIFPALRAIKRFVDLSINDLNLIDGSVMRNAAGKEVFSGGGNALIFKYELADGSICALRLFKHFPVGEDRIQRLSPLSIALEKIQSPILASYRFFHPGLHLANSDVVTPILMMGWVDGDSLGRYVEVLCKTKNTVELSHLLNRWLDLVREMRRIGLAHGDVTASNVMVRHSDRALVFVDYDDLYLPGLDDARLKVQGTTGYQHPKCKGGRPYGSRMDDFSLLLVTVSLAVLAERPEDFLSTDNLFFRSSDLEDTNSEAFEKMKMLRNPDVKPYVQSLISACEGSADDAVIFDEIVFRREIAEFEKSLRPEDRRSSRVQANLIRNLSVWSRYESGYEHIVNQVAEKSQVALDLVIASGHPDWIRDLFTSQNIRREDLRPDQRRKVAAILGEA